VGSKSWPWCLTFTAAFDAVLADAGMSLAEDQHPVGSRALRWPRACSAGRCRWNQTEVGLARILEAVTGNTVWVLSGPTDRCPPPCPVDRGDTEPESALGLAMAFPTDWDPYFRPMMSVLDVYHFGTQHFDHHRRQLTL
jgi:hypothetical protein